SAAAAATTAFALGISLFVIRCGVEVLVDIARCGVDWRLLDGTRIGGHGCRDQYFIGFHLVVLRVVATITATATAVATASAAALGAGVIAALCAGWLFVGCGGAVVGLWRLLSTSARCL